MNIIKTHCILIFTSFLLVGCVAGQYIAPSNSNTAKVRFVALNTIGNVFIYKYGSQSCIDDVSRVGVLNGPALNHYRKRIDIPLGKEFDDSIVTETTVEAGRPITFSMANWRFRATCSVNIEFTPKVNEYYEYRFSNLENEGKCAINVFRIVTSEDKGYIRVPEETAQKSNNKCVPMSSFQK